MKKVFKGFLFIFCFFNFFLVIKSDAAIIEIKNFNLDVHNELAQSKTGLTLTWTVEREIDEFKIYVELANGQKELSFVHSFNNGRDNMGSLIVRLNEDGNYDYTVDFEIDVIRTGNFKIEMIYSIGTEKYEYSTFIISKGNVVDKNYFTSGKAILVGFIISLFVIIGSLLIFESSKTEYELNDDFLLIQKNKERMNNNE